MSDASKADVAKADAPEGDLAYPAPREDFGKVPFLDTSISHWSAQALYRGYVDEFLFRSRALLIETIARGGDVPAWIIGLICDIHIRFGAADDFAALLRATGYDVAERRPIVLARLLLARRRYREALDYLAGVKLDPETAFALGWTVVHGGAPSPDLIAAARATLGRSDDAAIRPQLEALRAAAPATAKLDVLRTPNQFASAALVADVAGALADLVAGDAASGDRAALKGRTISPASTLTAAARDEARAAGLNLMALQIMEQDSPYLEAMDADPSERLRLAKDLPPFSDMMLFYGYLGQRQLHNPGRVLHFYRAAKRDGAVSALCPFTGRRVLSTESYFVDGATCFRFESEAGAFWMFVSGWQSRRAALWLQDENALLLLSPLFGVAHYREIVATLTAFLAANADAVAAYRSAPRRRAILSGLNANIGHNVHNEVSAVARFVADDLFAEGDVLLSGPYDYYNVFESVAGRAQTEITRLASFDEISKVVLERRLFVVWPTDVAVYRTACDAINAYAARTAIREEAAAGLKAVADADLAIHIVLRTKRRVWRRQENGVVQLLASLVARFDPEGAKRIAVVFDGYTRTGRDETEDRPIATERAIVDAITAMAPQMFKSVSVVNAIGFTLVEKARIAAHADLAIVPKGNGHLPTISWIANVPAVVHCNSVDLIGAMHEATLREDARAPLLLDRDDTFDDLKTADPAVAARTGSFYAEDYDVSWEGLMAKAMKLVDAKLRAR